MMEVAISEKGQLKDDMKALENEYLENSK